jgi:phospholipid N-methyltransferase
MLQLKGFEYEWTESEEDFMSKLEGNFDSAWIISGDAYDWALRLKAAPTHKQWSNFADAVERYDLEQTILRKILHFR